MILDAECVHYAARTGARRVWAIALTVAAFGMAGATTLDNHYGYAKALILAFCVIFVGLAMFRSVRAKLPERAHVTITNEGVDFGVSKLARSEIVSAQFSPAVSGRRASVRFLGKRDKELGYVTVRDHAQADDVLRALGMPPESAPASFYAMADISWMTIAFFTAVVGGFGGWIGGRLFGTPQLAYLGILPILAISAYLMPARVYVGADGLLWKTRVDPTFFAWKDVDRVAPDPRGISVILRTGQSVLIRTVQYSIRHEYQRVAQAALVTRANDAIAAFNRGGVPDVTARVARLGRTTEEWLAHLQDREGTFREAPLRTDDLWRVVESPAATATARAGAAAMIAREASDEDRARLRVAAEVCAEPRLRVVLDKAASGEDPLEALSDLDDEPKQARA